jgi:hypothetical protein
MLIPGSHTRNFRNGILSFVSHIRQSTLAASVSLRTVAALCITVVFICFAFKLSEGRLVYQQYVHVICHLLFELIPITGTLSMTSPGTTGARNMKQLCGPISFMDFA